MSAHKELKASKIGHGQWRVENNWNDIECDGITWEDLYVSFSGYFGPIDPAIFIAAPDLAEALKGAMDILGRAESNASGMGAEWDYVGPRVAACRAALEKAGVQS